MPARIPVRKEESPVSVTTRVRIAVFCLVAALGLGSTGVLDQEPLIGLDGALGPQLPLNGDAVELVLQQRERLESIVHPAMVRRTARSHSASGPHSVKTSLATSTR